MDFWDREVGEGFGWAGVGEYCDEFVDACAVGELC